jgi:hypothetical protein
MNYLKDDKNPPKAGEIIALKKACSPEEWESFYSQLPEKFQHPWGN